MVPVCLAAAHAIVHACHNIMAETLVFDGLTDKKEKLVNKLQEKIRVEE